MAHRQWQDSQSLANKGKTEAYHNYQRKYEQMTKQQQLIEQKKLEIQSRLEEKKKKETEESLKKLQEDRLRSAEASRSKRGYYGYSKPRRDRPEENPPTGTATNIFSNDGSFFEQFQKLSGIKVDAKRKSSKSASQSVETSNGNVTIVPESGQSPEVISSEENKATEKGEAQIDKRWPSPERTVSPPKLYQPQMIQPQLNQHLIHQQHVIQQHQVIQQQVIHQQHVIQQQQVIHQQQMVHQQAVQQPHLQQQVFTPQQMQNTMPPPMNMNYPPQFNPMQCGMMLPPPMTPSSIPPPAPLNPGSIPSPSPLQPGSIPSPSPLQPYAIPPPSPLIPHSIPPPSPMVPHSIPPPSPLTPHSIPPPLPLRPQSIPPPVQRPPLFLTMVPPPPPPPPPPLPEEQKSKIESVKVENSPSVRKKPEKMSIEDNVKDLFKNDDYSSSDEEDEDWVSCPSKLNQLQSDSESERERKSEESNSKKESSDTESEPKADCLSEIDSELEQDSRPIPVTESESEEIKLSSYTPIVIEDTQTQFPSDNKDSSNAEEKGEQAPPDLSSEGDSRPDSQSGSGSNPIPCDNPQDCSFTQEEVKQEPESNINEEFETEEEKEIQEEKTDSVIQNEEFNTNMKMENMDEFNSNIKMENVEEFKEEVKVEDDEKVKVEVGYDVKQENVTDIVLTDTNLKIEEPPVKKKRRSRWTDGDENIDIPFLTTSVVPPTPADIPPSVGPPGIVIPRPLGVPPNLPPLPSTIPTVNVPGMSGAMISKVTRTDPALLSYAMKSFGRTNLTDAEWKKAEDHYKINLLYQDMMRKKEELQRLQLAGKNKYEYDSDEETEGGTWEHKLRSAEMEATQLWADELTEQAKGKHHIGDFLPPDELARFMEKYEALKEGREPDLSDYKEFKLKEDNLGFQMLQKLGWIEGQGLGPDGSGIMDPVNKAMMRPENQGLGVERPEDVEADDDAYDAYRKRMMLAYRFRPNPMNNPRRPYY